MRAIAATSIFCGVLGWLFCSAFFIWSRLCGPTSSSLVCGQVVLVALAWLLALGLILAAVGNVGATVCLFIRKRLTPRLFWSAIGINFSFFILVLGSFIYSGLTEPPRGY